MVGKRVQLVEWKQRKRRSRLSLPVASRVSTDRSSLVVVELDLEKVMSPDEKKKLFEAIGYAGEDTSTSTYPEEVKLSSCCAVLQINRISALCSSTSISI